MQKKLAAVLVALTFLVMVTCTVAVVYAQDSSKPSLEDFATNFVKVLLPAIVSAVFNSMLGYFSSTNPDDFDPTKFIATLLIGMTIGAITVYTGWSYTQATDWLANAGLTLWLYWFAKIIAIKAGWIKVKTAVQPTPPAPT
jgi:uncharacterized membrane protein